LKAREGYIQGFNAQAVVDAGQLVLAAEITNSNVDWSHLDPMITAAITPSFPAGRHQAPDRELRWLMLSIGTKSTWTR